MRSETVTVADLVVSVAVVLALAVCGLAADRVLDEEASRKQCAANLRAMGDSLVAYANTNRGAYPRGNSDLGTEPNPKPTWGTPYADDGSPGPIAGVNPFAAEGTRGGAARPKFNDVTAALFLIVRNQKTPPAVFTCPATKQAPWDFGGQPARHWTNWPGNAGVAKHLSYSYQNPYPGHDAIGKGFRFNLANPRDFAMASDHNPGTAVLPKLRRDAPAERLREGNSSNHGGAGQNVLFVDGRVEFCQSPFVGVKRDNIFTVAQPDAPARTTEGFIASPTGPEDCILLPTAHHLLGEETGNEGKLRE